MTGTRSTVRRSRRVLGGFGAAIGLLYLALLAWHVVGWASVNRATRAQCSAMLGIALDRGRVVEARVSPAGFEPSWKTALIALWGFTLPEACRLSLVLTPSADSRIQTAVWLPTQRWNGRLQGIGNGGLAGSIDAVQMTSALSHGYAVAATDTGHVAADSEGSWALGHPEKVQDYGWRAIHETAVAAKRLILAFYGRPARYAYFAGGSNAGRAALMEAQRFPADYDGIVSGAPAYDGINTITTVTWMQRILNASEANHIPKSMAPVIAAAVLKACDGLDGVRDGLLEDPRACRFDPAALLCRSAAHERCLTAPQVASLRAIYDGPGGAFGDSRHWGFERGGEAGWGDWILGDKRGAAYHYGLSLVFHRFLVYGDPNWTFSRLSFWRDRVDTARKLGPPYAARSANLSRFAARGGKLILYHGWSDPALQPRLTIDYFERLRAQMGEAATRGFARLYMAPGVEHVFGGPGPNVFGQMPQGTAADPRKSVTAAVEAWVERGVAPGAIVAAKYSSDVKPLFAASGMAPLRTRPLCPYPAVARWKGTGSTDVAENFRCAGPPH